jgi:ricin-type beta-trefoil lectin protein
MSPAGSSPGIGAVNCRRIRSGTSKSAGAALIQWTVNNGANQHWTFAPSGSAYTTSNVASGPLVDVNGGSTADNAAIVQQSDTGDISQHWQLIAV